MVEMNFETARHNMIEQQIRPWKILDQRALNTICAIPREKFVPDHLKMLAFSDTELPIGHNQHMLAPKMEALTLQSMQIQPEDKILEIGTGSGYMTALLASQGGKVYTIELHRELSEQAGKRLADLGIDNVEYIVGNGVNGLEQNAPYDVIVMTGALPELPDTLKHQLSPNNGRLFAITGEAPAMQVSIITRISESQWSEEVLLETVVPVLEELPEVDHFVF